MNMCLHNGVPERVSVSVPTTLFITVIPAIVVSVTVPEAADTVAVLAVKLVFLALPGSWREKYKEGAFRRQIMRIQQKQKVDTVQECDKRQLSLSSADIISTAVLTPGRMWPFMSGSEQQAELSQGCRPELKDSMTEYPVSRYQHKHVRSTVTATQRGGKLEKKGTSIRVWLPSLCHQSEKTCYDNNDCIYIALFHDK